MLIELCMCSVSQISTDGHRATVFKLILGRFARELTLPEYLVVRYNNYIRLAR